MAERLLDTCAKRVPKTNYGELENGFFKNSSCGPAAMLYKYKLVYGILCATTRANWHRNLYSYLVAYCHSTVYCSKVNILPNYSRMPSVATGCCKKSSSFLVGNDRQASL